jgi:uncharacterized protein YqhQ
VYTSEGRKENIFFQDYVSVNRDSLHIRPWKRDSLHELTGLAILAVMVFVFVICILLIFPRFCKLYFVEYFRSEGRGGGC